MKSVCFDFVQATCVRRAVVPMGDIREDVAFQNDINGLLARFEGKGMPLVALDWTREPADAGVALVVPAESAPASRALRMIRGGLGVARSASDSRKQLPELAAPAVARGA